MTFGHTNVSQGSQVSSKRNQKSMLNITFCWSEQCVFHIVNTMLFFTLALPKCHQKQKKNTLQHILSHWHQKSWKCYSNCSKGSSHGPWRLSIVATFVILNVSFSCLSQGQKNHRFLITFEQVFAGAGGGGRGSSKLQILQILQKSIQHALLPWRGAANISEGLRPLPPAPNG